MRGVHVVREPREALPSSSWVVLDSNAAVTAAETAAWSSGENLATRGADVSRLPAERNSTSRARDATLAPPA